LSTSIALPKASRREVRKKREIIGKKPKHEVEGEREKEPKEIAFFKKWAVLPLPTAKTKEVEEEGGTIGRKPRREAKRDRERAGVKPRREIKRGQKIIEEKLAPMIVEKRPKLEVKKKREIVQKKLTREAKRKYKIAKEKPSHRPKEKRKIPEGEPTREIVEEKTASAIVEEKPKLEVERELELIEEKITPSIAEEKIMPTVIEEKPKLEKEHEVAEEMLKIIPTGISSLDGSIGGGFPSGSLVLLIGDIGSGYNEFAMTSSVMLAATKAGRIALPPGKNIVLPEEIWWVTFTRKQSDLMSEMAPSFDSDLFELFRKQANFKDLSEAYFATSSVPLEWVLKKPLNKGKEDEMLVTLGRMLAGLYNTEKPSSKPKDLLNSLADFLTERAPNNLVILNTLTDLAMLYSKSEADWYEFMVFLRGLQRATKEWGGLIYASLDANLLEERMEQEIAACVDGVLTFEWVQAGPTERRRTLYIKKFRRLPSSALGASMRFNVNLTSSVGLQVIKPELIEGLKA
jgi:archaellum biogenesis ATPase FlaH